MTTSEMRLREPFYPQWQLLEFGPKREDACHVGRVLRNGMEIDGSLSEEPEKLAELLNDAHREGVRAAMATLKRIGCAKAAARLAKELGERTQAPVKSGRKG